MTLPLRLIKDSQRQGFIENCRAGSYPILRMIEILSWGINDLRWAKLAASKRDGFLKEIYMLQALGVLFKLRTATL